MHAAMGDLDAALQDADVLDRLSTAANQGWMMRWMAWTVRADVFRQQRNPEYLAAAVQAEQETVGISVWANASANAILLGALLDARKFEEALVAAWVCIKAPTKRRSGPDGGDPRRRPRLCRARSVRRSAFHDRDRLRSRPRSPPVHQPPAPQLTGLATMLDALGRRSMLEPIARVALHLTTDPVGAGLRALPAG